MDTETLKHLLAVREVNKALIVGLRVAVYYLDKVDQISEERRESMIESLKCLITESEAGYGKSRRDIDLRLSRCCDILNISELDTWLVYCQAHNLRPIDFMTISQGSRCDLSSH